MNQAEVLPAPDRAVSRAWWARMFGPFGGQAEEEMDYQLPPDSLFANSWSGPTSVADVPEHLKAQITEEALLTAFNRLESSLRLLLYATTPGKEPPTAEHCHQILNVWRYELEHRVHLTPDTYCGAVQRYEADMESAYTIDGRCEPGDLLRIRVPCWRMHDRIVVRGEAELMRESDLFENPVAAPEPVTAEPQPKAAEAEAVSAALAVEVPESSGDAAAAALAAVEARSGTETASAVVEPTATPEEVNAELASELVQASPEADAGESRQDDGGGSGVLTAV